MSETRETPDLPYQVVSERTCLRLPSLPHWIEPAVEYLKLKAVLAGACQEERAGKLMLALHEALVNSIVHGNLELSSDLKETGGFGQALAERIADPRLAKRGVDVHIDYDGDCCRWTITDEGQGFDIDKVLRRCLSDDPEELLASGRGILIMRSFLDEVKYDLGGRRVILTLKRQSGTEKREEDRVSVHKPVQVAPILPDGTVDWQAAYEAVSRNISENGIGVIQEGLTATHKVLIGIPTSGQTVYVPAQVRHFRPLREGLFELGCQFQAEAAAPLPTPAPGMELAIETLMDQENRTTLTADERRTYPRVVYNSRIELITVDDKTQEGFTRDLSKGGVSFISTAPLSGEITLAFRPGDGGQPLKLRARIVRCARITDEFFDVGARFLFVEGA